jgi:hypothetical protein
MPVAMKAAFNPFFLYTTPKMITSPIRAINGSRTVKDMAYSPLEM